MLPLSGSGYQFFHCFKRCKGVFSLSCPGLRIKQGPTLVIGQHHDAQKGEQVGVDKLPGLLLRQWSRGGILVIDMQGNVQQDSLDDQACRCVLPEKLLDPQQDAGKFPVVRRWGHIVGIGNLCLVRIFTPGIDQIRILLCA